jgi:hypothetical protein
LKSSFITPSGMTAGAVKSGACLATKTLISGSFPKMVL